MSFTTGKRRAYSVFTQRKASCFGTGDVEYGTEDGAVGSTGEGVVKHTKCIKKKRVPDLNEVIDWNEAATIDTFVECICLCVST